MKFVIVGMVILLLIVRNDFWNWENDTLLMGFLPITLAYHCGISIAASITWYLATLFAWPELADGESEASTPQNQEANG